MIKKITVGLLCCCGLMYGLNRLVPNHGYPLAGATALSVESFSSEEEGGMHPALCLSDNGSAQSDAMNAKGHRKKHSKNFARKSVHTGVKIEKMVGMPDVESGYASGVSACYAGYADELLMIAGGCNFPELPLTKGGKKKYYNGIYVAPPTAGSLVWRKVGELPRTSAYGVCAAIPGGWIIAGGMNEAGTLTSVYRLILNKDHCSVKIDTLPSLPVGIDNMGGAVVGGRLFLIGGNVEGKPSRSLYSLAYDGSESKWTEEPSFPGEARIQPTCTAQSREGGRIYMWGGFAPSVNGSSATLSTDGYCYSLANRTWTPLASPMGKDSLPISLGGGAAVSLNDSLIVCAGGVNRTVFLEALRRGEMLWKAEASHNKPLADSLKAESMLYLSHPPQWYCFNEYLLAYNTFRNSWEVLLKHSSLARAGAALVTRGNTLFSIAGELKPGVRTSEVNKLTLRIK